MRTRFFNITVLILLGILLLPGVFYRVYTGDYFLQGEGSQHVWLPQFVSIVDTVQMLATVALVVLFAMAWRRHLARERDRRRQQELHEQDWKDAQKIAELGYWVYDVQSETLKVSLETLRIYDIGGDKEDAENETKISLDTILSKIHPGDVASVQDKWQAALEAEEAYEITHRIVMDDGKVHYVYVVAKPRYNVQGLLEYFGYSLDITHHKQLTEQLCLSERNLLQAQEIAHLGHWVLNGKNGTLTGSPEFYRIFRLGEVERVVLTEELLDQIHPEDVEFVLSQWRGAIEQERAVEMTYRLTPLAGELQRYVHESARPRKNELGDLEYIGFTQDITRGRQLEAQLRNSEQSLLDAMRVAKMGQWSYDVETQNFTGLENMRNVFPVFVEDIIAWSTFFDAVHQDDRLVAMEKFQRGIKENEVFEFLCRTIPDSLGQERYVYVFGKPQTDETGRRILQGVMQDVTNINLVKNELSLARTIQMDLLPQDFHPYYEDDLFSVTSVLKLARQVGGDFFDVVKVDEKKIAFVIGDVADKGVPAALFAATSLVLFRHILGETLEPRQILQKLNAGIVKNNPTMNFVTMFCGVVDFEAKQLSYSNAGHLPPIFFSADEALSYMELPQAPPVGVFAEAQYETVTIPFLPGNSILLYTDGIVEASDENDQLYGFDRLLNFCSKHRFLPARIGVQVLQNDITDFVGSAASLDDITLVNIAYNAERPPD